MELPDAFLGVRLDFSADPPRVKQVIRASPAEQVGIMEGDRIRTIGGVTIRTFKEFVQMLQSRKVGERVKVIVTRDGGEVQFEPVLGRR